MVCDHSRSLVVDLRFSSRFMDSKALNAGKQEERVVKSIESGIVRLE